ncbi:unnamed protein product [Didymodactylos carnosus]|uniref:Uncharacterized protein n=1 Tax=Didymodactylos carnosus TaxID=1234261 RepID=A0A814TLR3_9BILA|nr:unnamed protein product [Didymodactylos carnosus]CAF1163875.1 unnamed protein product [Didymodactylos carnosus]CAF3747038.1 unnamed protein product [Didymodactylos carnosus]CAF3927524.1 unnamed protein product [Didymodactylos carnosus]
MLHSLPEGDPKIEKCNIGLEKVANERENNPPEKRSEVVKMYMKRGKIWSEKQDYDRAIENYSKALDAQLNDDGPNNYETADIFTTLGHVYTTLKNYNLALQYYDEAFEIQAKLFEEYAPEIVVASNRFFESNSIDAREYSDSLVDLSRNYQKLPQSLNNKGKINYYKKEYERAMRSYERALEVQLLFHANGPQIEIAKTYINIAELYEERYHNYAEALLNYEKALDVYEKAAGSVFSQEVAKIHNDIMRVKTEFLNSSSLSPRKTENESRLEEITRPEQSEANVHVDIDEEEDNFLNEFQRQLLLRKALLSKGHDLSQIVAIYIYCRDSEDNEQWSNAYEKVR